MIKPLAKGIKSLHPGDVDELGNEYPQLLWLGHEFSIQCPGARIDTPITNKDCHPFKMWEWARALREIKRLAEVESKELSILSIGSAYDLLSPSLCYINANFKVTEAEPDYSCILEREKLNKFLQGFNGNPITCCQNGYGGLRQLNKKFDVVLSISTLEHVNPIYETLAWEEMSDVLNPGGLLVVTMDCMQVAKRGYRFDEVRQTNYDMSMIRNRVEILKALGFSPVGEEDYGWNGSFVNDYSFASIIMRKTPHD